MESGDSEGSEGSAESVESVESIDSADLPDGPPTPTSVSPPPSLTSRVREGSEGSAESVESMDSALEFWPVAQTPSGGWSCEVCTLDNKPSAHVCAACETRRPWVRVDEVAPSPSPSHAAEYVGRGEVGPISNSSLVEVLGSLSSADGSSDEGCGSADVDAVEAVGTDEDEAAAAAVAAAASSMNAKDIELVISQASCSRSQAIEALQQNNGDIVNAIMEIWNRSSIEEIE
eukprot:FR735518.1.p1 GENE.FR735518.1~~FR735518.1.p1  ORF type:complete len:241 (+),score=14.13 FR735518.1:33-725(+)